MKLSEYLEKVNKSTTTIMSYWYRFGSNGYEKQPQNIRESFLLRYNDIETSTSKGKVIIKPEIYDVIGRHLHNFFPKKNIEHLDVIDDYDELKLFHYSTMSKEYFEKIKMSNTYFVCDNETPYKYKLSTFKHIDDRSQYKDTTLSDLIKYGYN